MKFEMVDHLPLVAVEIEYNGNKKSFGNVLLDTGSSSTILDRLLHRVEVIHGGEDEESHRMKNRKSISSAKV